MGVIIKSIEFALPKTKESLEDVLKENPNWDVKKYYQKQASKIDMFLKIMKTLYRYLSRVLVKF